MSKPTIVTEVSETPEKTKNFVSRHKTKLTAGAIALAAGAVFVLGRRSASPDEETPVESQD